MQLCKHRYADDQIAALFDKQVRRDSNAYTVDATSDKIPELNAIEFALSMRSTTLLPTSDDELRRVEAYSMRQKPRKSVADGLTSDCPTIFAAVGLLETDNALVDTGANIAGISSRFQQAAEIPMAASEISASIP